MFKNLKIVLCLVLIIVLSIFSEKKTVSQDINTLAVKQVDSVVNTVESQKYKRYKFNLYSGGLFSNLDGSILVNGNNTGIGSNLDFENNLGLSSFIATYMLEGIYNISRKSSLRGSFFALNRSSSILLTDSIKFGDYKFKGNARFDFLLDFTYMGLNYRYNFVVKPRFTIGAAIGLRLFRIRTSGTGSTTFNGQTESSSFEKKMVAPGMLIGFNGDFYILPNLYSRSSLEFFSLKVGNISAGLFEAKVALEYYFIKNLGVGISALAYVYKMNSGSNEYFNGEVSYNFKGLNLYLAARF